MISVIVPVYNVEKTLDRCIQSILNQTFKDIEIILVDDGSTDNSGNICDEYAKKYSNIRIIHKENEGLGPTRNRGILESKGEYIYHCDSDDWLKEDLLEKAYNSIVETNADVVIFGYEIFTENNGELSTYDKITIKDQYIENKKASQRLFVEHYFSSFVLMSACNRLQRRSFIVNNNLFFPDLRRSQDMAYSFLFFEKLEKLVVIDEPLYCYVIEPGVFKGRSYGEMLSIYKNIFDIAKQKFIQWELYDIKTERRLVDYVCQQIANYSAYAFIVKYKRDRRANANLLMKDATIRELFSKYSNAKKSKFMKFFRFGIKMKSKSILFLVSKMVQKRTK